MNNSMDTRNLLPFLPNIGNKSNSVMSVVGQKLDSNSSIKLKQHHNIQIVTNSHRKMKNILKKSSVSSVPT